MSKLDETRNKINQIDQEMARLFEERMACSKEVAEYKKERALPILDKERELSVINKNLEYIKEDIIKEYYTDFLKDVMRLSRNYQERLNSGQKIAYCGTEGAFAHIAAKKMFAEANYVAYPSFKEAYEAVENGECDSAVLPLENSYAGDVGIVMDLIFQGPLSINQVIELEVTHNLIAKKGTKIEQIKKVISHEQALNQCMNYISEHNYEVVEATNTAVAAKLVASSNDDSLAAIASIETASLYDLEVLDKNINSKSNNTTRFGAFSKISNEKSSQGKVGEHFIIMFTVKNEAGALAKTLNIIGSYGFNMRSLRSRPLKELIWNYYFYVELEGNASSPEGKDMLRALNVFCDKLKLVGAYSL